MTPVMSGRPIESGAASVNQRIPAPVYQEGTPILTIAARSASIEVMRYLISAGADVNAPTPAGETPLMLAAYFFDENREQGSRPTTSTKGRRGLLVEAGANIENAPHHYTPSLMPHTRDTIISSASSSNAARA